MISNNDILRRIRYIFDFSDDKMVALFAEADFIVTRAQVSEWLKKEDADDARAISDQYLAAFLNGLINDKRGKKEGTQPIPERKLNNNQVLRKLKIALNLKDHDMVAIFKSAGISISKHELSAFFRKPGHSQYKPCQDQYMRNFLKGLAKKYRNV